MSHRAGFAARIDAATEPAEPKPKAKPRAKREQPQRAPAPSGGVDALGDFLNSREGKAVQRKVLRGVFGMLKKRL